MKRLLAASALLFLLSLSAASQLAAQSPVAFDWFEYEGRDAIFEEPLGPGEFQNPILAGFYPDPSSVRVGEDFYVVTSTFSYFPGVPIFHSKDLVNWRQIGNVLDRPSQLETSGLRVSEGVFAPAIRHHDGVFYMITTTVQGINNFYVTATDPAGPWSEPNLLSWVDGIDPSLFFDDDGRVYLTHNGPPPNRESLYEGHRAVWLWEIDLETNEPIGEGKIIINGGVDLSKQPVWIEAPHVFKKDGWYYLTCAEGGTSVQHSQVIFRAKSMDGEWVPWEGNPILTQRDLSPERDNPIVAAGHADFLELENGDWWATFLAIRPYEGGFYNTGRETFLLPIEWNDEGWPVILERGEEIPWRLPKPDLPEWTVEGTPTTGNFAWRDEFTDATLGFEWNFLRTPKGNWASVDTAKGHLLIAPQVHDLDSLENVSWLATRQHHSTFDAATRLQAPVEGVSAGVAALIREDYYFYCGVRLVDGEYVAFLEKAENGKAVEVAATPIAGLAPGEWLTLSIEAAKAEISFYVQAEGGPRLSVAEGEDATILTTTRAWSFVGAQMGPYARLEL